MNKLFTLLALFVFTISSYAQKIRFTDTTNNWYQTYFHQYGTGSSRTVGYKHIYYDGDTMINGKTYQFLYTHDCFSSMHEKGNKIYFSALVREDSSGVYAFVDTADVYVYNYNWQLGDTLDKGSIITTVTQVDSVQINSVYHKVWELSRVHQTAPTFNNKINVIEGLGSTVGVFISHYWHGLNWNELLCFKNQNSAPPFSNMHNYFDNQSSCNRFVYCPPTNINDRIITEELQSQIIPHPATANSFLQIPARLSTGTVSVYNNQGQLVVKEQIQNTQQWQLRNRISVPGIYFFQISSTQTSEVFTRKFIYE